MPERFNGRGLAGFERPSLTISEIAVLVVEKVIRNFSRSIIRRAMVPNREDSTVGAALSIVGCGSGSKKTAKKSPRIFGFYVSTAIGVGAHLAIVCTKTI